jgi:hypothetical protein
MAAFWRIFPSEGSYLRDAALHRTHGAELCCSKNCAFGKDADTLGETRHRGNFVANVLPAGTIQAQLCSGADRARNGLEDLLVPDWESAYLIAPHVTLH